MRTSIRRSIAHALGFLTLTAGVAMTGCSGGSVRADPPDGDWQRIDAAQTLSFADPGRVSGDAGCNQYSGAVQSDASGAMRIGPVMATKRACADSERMRAEADFLRMFDDVRGFRIESDSSMALVDAAGNVLAVFERMSTRSAR